MKKLTIALILCALLLTAAGCNQGGDSGSQSEASTASETAEPSSEVSGAASTAGEDIPETPDLVDGPVATMGDYTVNLTDYAFFYTNFQNSQESQAAQFGYTEENIAEYWNTEQDGVTMENMLSTEAMSYAIQYSVLHKRAQDAGTQANAEWDKTTDADVDSVLSDFGGDENRFRYEYRLNPAQMKEVLHRLNLVDKYKEEVKNAVETTEDECKAYYDANSANYDQVTVRHVLVLCDDEMTEAEQAAAKEKADSLLKQVQEGADIGQLATEHSEDTGSKDTGGEYTFGRGEMVEEFETWSYDSAVGDTGVVKTSYGYHVMQKIADSSYEERKDQVEEDLRIEKASQLLQDVADLMDSPDWTVDDNMLNQVRRAG